MSYDACGLGLRNLNPSVADLSAPMGRYEQ